MPACVAVDDRRVLLAVAVGGALGASARYGVSRLIPTAPDGFPWSTLWINVSGSFALGLVVVRVMRRELLYRFVATGVLGGYTTFSTFAVEAVVLAKDDHVLRALAYVAASVAGGLAAAWAGVTIADRT